MLNLYCMTQYNFLFFLEGGLFMSINDMVGQKCL